MLFLVRIIHPLNITEPNRSLYLSELSKNVPTSTYTSVGEPKKYLSGLGLEITYKVPDDYVKRERAVGRMTLNLWEYVEKALGPIMESDKQLDYCIRPKKE
jgi:hypothetical protein